MRESYVCDDDTATDETSMATAFAWYVRRARMRFTLEMFCAAVRAELAD